MFSGLYDSVAPIISKIPYDGFFVEYDDERSGGFEPWKILNGSKATFVVGLISTKNARLETQEEIKQVKTYCNESLNAVLSQVVGSYHLMEIHHFEPIIHNIIFEGLPQMQKELLFKKENHDVGSI